MFHGDVDHFMDAPDRIPFILVDDHGTLAEALGYSLSVNLPLDLISYCDRIYKAVAVCREKRPRLVIFDWCLPEGSGVELPRLLAKSLPETRWLLFTGFPTPYVVRQAIEAGAHGSVSKAASHSELLAACQALLSGKTYYCQESARALQKIMQNRSRDALLNPTEQEILRCVAEGKEPKQIAECLNVALGTVRNYLVQIRQKLSVGSMVNLAKYAIEHGLAPPH